MTPDMGRGPRHHECKDRNQPSRKTTPSHRLDGAECQRSAEDRRAPRERPNDPLDIDLTTCNVSEFIAFLAGYRSGIWQGTAEQIARREAEDRAVYRMAVRVVHDAADWPEQPAHRQVPQRWTDRRRPLDLTDGAT